MKPLDYTTLTNPQRKAVTAYYALKFGGTRTEPLTVNGHTLLSLRNAGWLEWDEHGGITLSTAGIEAVRTHKLAKKANQAYRDYLENIASMARAAKARVEKSA